MNLVEFINAEFMVLIAVLFGIGKIIKHTKKIADEYIPIILMIVGILFSIALGGLNVDSVIQGIVVCTVTVWGNEAVTQLLDKKGSV